MARIRTIKPEFFKNEQLGELTVVNRLLFIGLWTQADREGKLEDRPKRLKVEIFPYDDFDINNALNELQSAGLIVRYECSDGDDKFNFIKILTFEKHQQPNVKEAKSVIPEPKNVKTPYKHGADMVQASQERKGKEREQEREQEGKGKEGDRGRLRFSPPTFDDILNYFILKKIETGWPDEKCDFQAKKFMHHYESNGWMVGKNKMSKWKSAAAGWINRDAEFAQNNQKNNSQKNGKSNNAAFDTIDRVTQEYVINKYGPDSGYTED